MRKTKNPKGIKLNEKEINEPIGKAAGDSVVLKYSGYYSKNQSKRKFHWYLCRCKCGNEFITRRDTMLSSDKLSCGCNIGGIAKHGMYNSKFYKTWQSIHQRCNNPKDHTYPKYGGRGIKVCDKWNEFANFYVDMYELYIQHIRKHGKANTSIDRIDVNGNYEPSNCRWATMKEQNRNTRRTKYVKYCNKEYKFVELIEEKGLSQHYATILTRINNLGWSVEKAIDSPIKTG